jgi:hypothetical protein
MINTNFLRFIAEINPYKIIQKQVSFISAFYKDGIPDEWEKTLIKIFEITYIFHDFITISVTLGNDGPVFLKYNVNRYTDEFKELHIKTFVKSIYNILPNLEVKEFNYQHVDNVFELIINNQYKIVLSKNKNNDEITIHSIHNKKTKTTNHFNIVLNYQEFKNFLNESEETFEMNRDLFDMWSM